MSTSILLIVLLFVLLAGGIWISITLGIVAWAGVALAVDNCASNVAIWARRDATSA